MTLIARQNIEKSWRDRIGSEFDKPYVHKLAAFLDTQSSEGKNVFPPQGDIFNALRQTPFDRVKAVIIGQDPYHAAGQAHGLSFSVREGVRLPPSLRNIYKEIEAEYGVSMPKSGDLTGWARQGVLLLNATLTVEEAKAGSHQKKGWEEFTDSIIRAVSEHKKHVVFILWGSYAQKKGEMIDRKKHLVLEGPHPSPLSAHRGFFGCGHFRKTNDYLISHGEKPIDWQAAG